MAGYNLNLTFLALGILIAVFGAYFGSFCSKVIYRLENKRMNVKSLTGASVCPNCFKRLAFKDKIPVISYLRLKGKCRRCGAPITKRYLVLELTGMVLPFILIIVNNFDITAVLDYFFVMALICCFYITYDGYEFPGPIIIFILLLSILKTEFSLDLLLQAGLSAVISFIITFIIYNFICKKDRTISSLFFMCIAAYMGLISSLIILVLLLILTTGRKFLKIKIKANLILVLLILIDFAFKNFIEESVIRLITFIFS